MTLFGEFRVPTDVFALEYTFERVPETVIEIERVVASDELLTPYFWVSGDDLAAFETATEDDTSIRGLRRLDAYDETALYRARWTDNIDAIVFAYTHVGAIIIEAIGQRDEWELQIRFEDQECLEEFHDYCRDNDVPFDLQRLYEESTAKPGARYGLTRKQYEALETAWQMGYFETPRQTTLSEVGDRLEISKQSLSQRLRRAHQTWVANALHVTPPEDSPNPV